MRLSLCAYKIESHTLSNESHMIVYMSQSGPTFCVYRVEPPNVLNESIQLSHLSYKFFIRLVILLSVNFRWKVLSVAIERPILTLNWRIPWKFGDTSFRVWKSPSAINHLNYSIVLTLIILWFDAVRYKNRFFKKFAFCSKFSAQITSVSKNLKNSNTKESPKTS